MSKLPPVNEHEDTAPAAPFSEFMQSAAHGRPDTAIGKRLRELVLACRQNQGKGSMTITINITPKDEFVDIAIKTKSTKPEPGIPSAIFFTDEVGNLCDEDPRQTKLPLRVLEVAPPRVVKRDGDV